jgi:hypothetical protein
VPVNWTAVFNRLFKIIDSPKYYYSGPTFFRIVQEVREDFPNYHEYIKQRSAEGLSTTRMIYFKDILLSFNEEERRSFVYRILDDVESRGHESSSEIRGLIGGTANAPSATIPAEAWNGTRLTNFLREIDSALQDSKPERALTLAYTCMEGFFKAYVQRNVPGENENEITALARIVKDDLRKKNPEYPGEVFNVITQAANAINKVRDRFSESHFQNEADIWAATYVRDLVNTHICLLLHFM